jgi:hypothetical protein
MRRDADEPAFCGCNGTLGCSEEFYTSHHPLVDFAGAAIEPETLVRIIDSVPREIGPTIVVGRSEKPQLTLAGCRNMQWLGGHQCLLLKRSFRFHTHQ